MAILVTVQFRRVRLDVQVGRHVGMHDWNGAFSIVGGMRWGSRNCQNSVGRQRRSNCVLIVVGWKLVLANKRTLDLSEKKKRKQKCVLGDFLRIVIRLSYRAVSIGSLLVFALDDDHVVDRLHRDLRWLKMVHVDHCLESIFAKVQRLLVCHVTESLASDLPWTTIASRQMVLAQTWYDHLRVQVARQKSQSET